MSACLEFIDVHKSYRVRRGVLGTRATVPAVNGVDLAVAQGETVGLVGESGCGKSTLARLAVSLEPPTSGRIRLEGNDLWEIPQARLPGLAQMIFQDPFSSFDPRMAIGQSVGEGLLAANIGDKRSRRARVLELLDMVGLSASHAGRYPHQFSGGQRQRAAIARALALTPKLIVCDEPVSALDVSIQAQVLNILEDLKNQLGLTYLFISHDLAVVSHLSDRVAVMYAGQLMELAPSDILYTAPRHPYTRMLLAAAPDPKARPGTLRPGESRQTAPQRPAAGQAPAQACPLLPRCPEADAACAMAPPWQEISPGHFVRCRHS